MNAKLFRDRLLGSTIVAGALLAAPAMAQTDPGQGATPTAPVVGGSAAASQPVGTTSVDANGSSTSEPTTIVVTGSRISNPNLTSTSPVTAVGAAEVKLQGTTRVEDLLNSLPQVFASEGSTDSNGASGIATVDLRDLGASRTLVLINGRRLVPGDPADPVADINFIPQQLIQRVDVLTGGGASVYGSDAVSGVVNFVLDTKFEGVRLDAQYSFYQHDNDIGGTLLEALRSGQGGVTRAYNNQFPRGNTVDGFQKNVSLAVGAGTSDGRGHVTAYATWRQTDPVRQADRDYSYCGASDGTYNAAANGVAASQPGLAYCGGSSTTDVGRFRRTQNVALGDLPVYGAFGSSFTTNPAAPGTFRTYSAARDAYNFNPTNYFQRPDERYTLGAFANYEVSKALNPYLEVMFMDDRTSAVIAPSGAFYGTDFFINCNNPLLSASQATSLCGANAGTATLQSLYVGRRNVEGGGRVDNLRHTDYRIVLGSKGEIAKGITYDAYGQFGRAILAENYQNDFSRSRLNNALNVVTNAAGQPVCASTLPNAQGQVVDANCVPYNIFTPGGVTQQALNYLQTPGFREGQTTEYVASGSISADLGQYGLKSPLSNDGVQLAIGAEYRKEALLLQNDVEFLTGDLAGQGTPFGVPNAKGSFDVKEEFAELEVPFISERKFFYSLSGNASYRHSKYSSSGTTDTYKFGATYAPIKGFSFRGAYNRAVRAPNILDLFNPQTVQLFSGTDPCAGGIDTDDNNVPLGTVNGNTAAQCARTGVTAAQFGTIDPSPAGQYNQRTAGNTNLKPEVADTYTAGVVINPAFLRNFVLTVDGYDIKIKKLISTQGAQFTLQQCLDTGAAGYCSRVVRSADGSLFTGNSFVDNPTENLGSEHTRGIDVAASYRFDLQTVGINNFGSVGFDLTGTYLDYFKVQPLAGGGNYNCAGRFGLTCGSPLPKWRHKFRVTWTLPEGVQLSGQWRYFNHTRNDNLSSNPLIQDTSISGDPLTSRIKNVSYFDLSITTRIADKYTFRLGAQNLLDKTPPITYEYGNSVGNGSNTYAQVYDTLGRYIYAGVTLDF